MRVSGNVCHASEGCCRCCGGRRRSYCGFEGSGRDTESFIGLNNGARTRCGCGGLLSTGSARKYNCPRGGFLALLQCGSLGDDSLDNLTAVDSLWVESGGIVAFLCID